jgi:hypothetical protein
MSDDYSDVVSFTRTYFGSAEDDAAAEFQRQLEGWHFAEQLADLDRVFVPFVGLRLPPACTILGPGEVLLELEQQTWRSLESHRYRDIYDDVVLRFPRAYLLKQLVSAEGDPVTDCFDPGKPLGRETGEALEALLAALHMCGSGGIVSPYRLPWVTTSDSQRCTLNRNRLRLYSFVPRDLWRPTRHEVQVGDQVEVYHNRVGILELDCMALGAESLRTIAVLCDMIRESAILRRCTEFRALCRLYSEWSDPFLPAASRNIRFVVTFERVFGPLSQAKIERTARRVNIMLPGDHPGGPIPAEELSGAFRLFRNSVSHGSGENAEAQQIIGAVDKATKAFFAGFVLHGRELVDGLAEALPLSFERVKRDLFGEG